MQRYTLTAAQAAEHQPDHPERTARRPAAGFLNFDVVFQVWPNRPSLARSVRMQERREHRRDDWHPCVKLRETEGY